MTSQSTLGFTPLAGFKVLDLSQGVAGPYCAQLLGHQGAEVIKVEPAQGDWGRHVGVARNGHSIISCTYNAGKQSLAVDAKHPEGKAIVLELAKQAFEKAKPGYHPITTASVQDMLAKAEAK